MKSNTVFILLALGAGACLPTQAGINSRLNILMGSPILTAAVSFGVGTISLMIHAVVTGARLPGLSRLGEAPWWLWSGGLLGAFLVASTVILAPRLGAGTMLSLIIAGQMTTSLFLDHFGLIGYTCRPMDYFRFSGAVLIIAGVFLIRR